MTKMSNPYLLISKFTSFLPEKDYCPLTLNKIFDLYIRHIIRTVITDCSVIDCSNLIYVNSHSLYFTCVETELSKTIKEIEFDEKGLRYFYFLCENVREIKDQVENFLMPRFLMSSKLRVSITTSVTRSTALITTEHF